MIELFFIVFCDGSSRTLKSSGLMAAAVIPQCCCAGVCAGCYEGYQQIPSANDKYLPLIRCVQRFLPNFSVLEQERYADCGFYHAIVTCFNSGYYPAHSISSCMKRHLDSSTTEKYAIDQKMI